MKNFKDFGIKTSVSRFTGDKIKIKKILNGQIVVHDFSVEDSKFDGKCLYLQISVDGTNHILFTGSKVLIDMIQHVPKTDFPFNTTIVQEDERLMFT